MSFPFEPFKTKDVTHFLSQDVASLMNIRDDKELFPSICHEIWHRNDDILTTFRILNELLLGPDMDETVASLRMNDVKSGVCGGIWEAGDYAFRCNTCSISESSCICPTCFQNGDHSSHDYSLYKSESGGTCDCGTDSWSPLGCCADHQPSDTPEEPIPLEEPYQSRLSVIFRTVIRELISLLWEDDTGSSESVLLIVDWLRTISGLSQSFLQMLITILTESQSVQPEAQLQLRRWFARTVPKEFYNTHNFEHLIAGLPHTSTLAPLPQPDSEAGSAPGPSVPFTFRVGNIFGRRRSKSDAHRDRALQMVRSLFDSPQYQMIDLILAALANLHNDLIVKLTSWFLELLFKPSFRDLFSPYFVLHYPRFLLKLLCDPASKLGEFLDRISCIVLSTEPCVEALCKEDCQAELAFVGGFFPLFFRLTLFCYSGALASSNGSIDCAKLAKIRNIANRHLHHLTTTFQYPSVVKIVVSSESIFGLFVQCVEALQGMNPVTRQYGEHIEFDVDREEGAYLLELSTLMPLHFLIQAMGSDSMLFDTTFQYLKAYLDSSCPAHAYTEGMFSPFNIGNQPVSIHIPLHRLFASILATCTKNIHSIESIVPCEYWHRIIEEVLRIQIFVSQVEVGMWRRNGASVNRMAAFYRAGAFLDLQADLDIFLLQCAATVLDPDYFVNMILHAFNLTDYFQRSMKSDDGYTHFLIERFLGLIWSIISYYRYLGISRSESIREKLLHALAVKPKTHSELASQLSHRTAESGDFSEQLSNVAVFNQTTSKHMLTENSWGHFNPYFAHLNRQEYQSAMENWPSNLRKASLASTPLLKPPLKAFEALCPRLFQSGTLFRVLSAIITKQTSDYALRSALCLLRIYIDLNRDCKDVDGLYSTLAHIRSDREDSDDCHVIASHILSLLKPDASIPMEEDDERTTELVDVKAESPPKERRGSTIDDIRDRQAEILAQFAEQQKNFAAKFDMVDVSDEEIDEELGESTSESSSPHSNKRRTRSFDSPPPSTSSISSGFTSASAWIGWDRQKSGFGRRRSSVFSDVHIATDCVFCIEPVRVVDIHAPLQTKSDLVDGAALAYMSTVQACEFREGLSLQLCGHVMHFACRQRFIENLQKSDLDVGGGLRMGGTWLELGHPLVNPHADEFQCPLCRRICNCYVPLVGCHQFDIEEEAFVNCGNTATILTPLSSRQTHAYRRSISKQFLSSIPPKRRARSITADTDPALSRRHSLTSHSSGSSATPTTSSSDGSFPGLGRSVVRRNTSASIHSFVPSEPLVDIDETESATSVDSIGTPSTLPVGKLSLYSPLVTSDQSTTPSWNGIPHTKVGLGTGVLGQRMDANETVDSPGIPLDVPLISAPLLDEIERLFQSYIPAFPEIFASSALTEHCTTTPIQSFIPQSSQSVIREEEEGEPLSVQTAISSENEALANQNASMEAFISNLNRTAESFHRSQRTYPMLLGECIVGTMCQTEMQLMLLDPLNTSHAISRLRFVYDVMVCASHKYVDDISSDLEELWYALSLENTEARPNLGYLDSFQMPGGIHVNVTRVFVQCLLSWQTVSVTPRIYLLIRHLFGITLLQAFLAAKLYELSPKHKSHDTLTRIQVLCLPFLRRIALWISSMYEDGAFEPNGKLCDIRLWRGELLQEDELEKTNVSSLLQPKMSPISSSVSPRHPPVESGVLFSQVRSSNDSSPTLKSLPPPSESSSHTSTFSSTGTDSIKTQKVLADLCTYLRLPIFLKDQIDNVDTVVVFVKQITFCDGAVPSQWSETLDRWHVELDSFVSICQDTNTQLPMPDIQQSPVLQPSPPPSDGSPMSELLLPSRETMNRRDSSPNISSSPQISPGPASYASLFIPAATFSALPPSNMFSIAVIGSSSLASACCGWLNPPHTSRSYTTVVHMVSNKVQLKRLRVRVEAPLLWQWPQLIPLPVSYEKLFFQYHSKTCSLCKRIPKKSAVCLVCGALVCFLNGECFAHARSCGYGTCVFLVLDLSKMLFIRGSRHTFWPSPYRDAHGEEDFQMQRGRPLFLQANAYKLSELWWQCNSFDLNTEVLDVSSRYYTRHM